MVTPAHYDQLMKDHKMPKTLKSALHEFCTDLSCDFLSVVVNPKIKLLKLTFSTAASADQALAIRSGPDGPALFVQ